MMKLQKPARLLAALAVTGALALPTFAQDKMGGDKMMDNKMAPKMSGGKMMDKMAPKMGHKMMMPSSKMVCQMCKMTPMESKTYKGMSKSEKMLFVKHMDKMGMDKMGMSKMGMSKMGHSKMMGGKM